jgi:hypothetical protein
VRSNGTGCFAGNRAKGFSVAVRNARDVHWRGEGGAQERELAGNYRRLAQQTAFGYPYVGSVLESITVSYYRETEWQDFGGYRKRSAPITVSRSRIASVISARSQS